MATLLKNAASSIITMKRLILINGERGLTKGETALVKGIFGEEMSENSLALIRIASSPEERQDRGADTNAKGPIIFYILNGTSRYRDDFSQAEPGLYSLFVHEVTHKWQFSKGLVGENLPAVDYKYQISPEARFEDFTIEQQAAIIQDYTRHFLHPKTYEDTQYHQTFYDSPESDALLQKIVEDKFPVARKTRLSMARQKKQQYRLSEAFTKAKHNKELSGKLTKIAKEIGMFCSKRGLEFKYYPTRFSTWGPSLGTNLPSPGTDPDLSLSLVEWKGNIRVCHAPKRGPQLPSGPTIPTREEIESIIKAVENRRGPAAVVAKKAARRGPVN